MECRKILNSIGYMEVMLGHGLEMAVGMVS